MKRYEEELREYLTNKHSGILSQIREEKKLTDDIKGKLSEALKEFAAVFEVAE